ncbi:MAG: undecaprenyldiphospho-muramoylpentapeptide beta-N-acetylglucosaminyltransferase [Eubacteriales bacterium]|nr:undecaprenyldiphospho-muramoylpentapeptide beta-N-acetylglucosaminyltransferase [Eubacteriales bacterium]
MSEMKARKLVFVGGGTAGHIYPTLAVATALRELLPEAEFYYAISEDGPERDLVDWKEFKRLEINAARTPLKKSGYPAFALKNTQGVLSARRVLKKLRPDLVFAGGGFVSAPLLAAAQSLGIASYLHEQNAIPGRVTRLFSKKAKAVFTSFPGTESAFPAGCKIRYTGNPVRGEFFKAERSACRKQLGIQAKESWLLVLGGSLGAKALNDCIAALPETAGWSEFKQRHPGFRIMLVSGLVNSRIFKAEFAEDEIISASNYVDSKLWIPASDLVLGRAGASILMELAACQKPAIIVPFPEAANAHQDANAELFKKNDAAIVLQQDKLSPQALLNLLDELLKDQERRAILSQNIASLAKLNAAKEIADIVVKEL